MQITVDLENTHYVRLAHCRYAFTAIIEGSYMPSQFEKAATPYEINQDAENIVGLLICLLPEATRKQLKEIL